MNIAQEYHHKTGRSSVIINADSMQIYDALHMLTAQPDAAIQYKDIALQYKLYSALAPEDECSMARWYDMAANAADIALQHQRLPIIVGGTGMYINAIYQGISSTPDITPSLRAAIRTASANGHIAALQHAYIAAQHNPPPRDKQRLARALEILLQTGRPIEYWQSLPRQHALKGRRMIAYKIMPEREQLYMQCNIRLEKMVKNGAIEEVEALINSPVPRNAMIYKALGVQELTDYINGDLSLDQAIAAAQQSTRRYAKRQYSWLKHQMDYATTLTPQRYEDRTALQALGNSENWWG